MRRLLVLMFIIALGGAGAVAAQDMAALPRDETSLRALDSQQLRLVRRAGAQCAHSGEALFGETRSARARACIRPLVDRAVATSDNPALQAYHEWLPVGVRYDENRPGNLWHKLVTG